MLLAGACLVVCAQNAKLAGELTDATGSSIPGATVQLLDVETLAKLKATTGREGEFLFPSVPPGTWELQAEAQGFRSLTRSGLKLDVASSSRLRLTMEVGSVSDRIEVTAEAAPVYTTSQSVESTVTREQIATLPLNSRDFNQLVLLAAGAVENINAGNGRDFGGVAANGNRSFSNDYTIDGSPNNDMYQGLPALPLSIDTIREFKVTSGAASAQYGQAGTQVTVITRGGTNKFRGSAVQPASIRRIAGRSGAAQPHVLLRELRRLSVARGRDPRIHRAQ